MDGWHQLITSRQINSEKNGIHFYPIGKRWERKLRTSITLLFQCSGILTQDKINNMINNVLSPTLGRPANELKGLLVFGSIDECVKKIKAFLEVGVNSIHFWPVNNYVEQIEIFSEEIIPSFR